MRLMALLPMMALAALSQNLYAKPSHVDCIVPGTLNEGAAFTCRVPVAQLMPKLKLVRGQVKVIDMPDAAKVYASIASNRRRDTNLLVAASMETVLQLGQNLYTGFDAKDVHWVGALGIDYGVIAVQAESPIKNLSQLVSMLESDPEQLTIAGNGAKGGWDHYKVLLIAEKAGIRHSSRIRYTPFDSTGQAMAALVQGRADVFTGDTSAVLEQFDRGDIRVLALLAPKRSPHLPGVKTATEQGVDALGGNWHGLYAPRRIGKRYAEWVEIFTQLAKSDEWHRARERQGLAPLMLTGREFSRFVADQISHSVPLTQKLKLQ